MPSVRSLLPLRSYAIAIALTSTLLTTNLRAQGQADEMRAALLADLENLRGKFVGLAEVFPADKYNWKPMEGVRSVAEVLMLAAFEGYSFIPSSFGGQRADLGPNAAALRTLTDKAQVIEHLNKGFAHAKKQIETIDAATLTGSRPFFGQTRGPEGLSLGVFGDLHEHLGQLIAYARMNQLVPPWTAAAQAKKP